MRFIKKKRCVHQKIRGRAKREVSMPLPRLFVLCFLLSSSLTQGKNDKRVPHFKNQFRELRRRIGCSGF